MPYDHFFYLSMHAIHRLKLHSFENKCYRIRDIKRGSKKGTADKAYNFMMAEFERFTAG